MSHQTNVAMKLYNSNVLTQDVQNGGLAPYIPVNVPNLVIGPGLGGGHGATPAGPPAGPPHAPYHGGSGR